MSMEETEKLEQFSIKTGLSGVAEALGLPGTLEARWTRCGRSSCRCASGAKHGPYWTWTYMDAGKRVRAYVRVEDYPAMAAAIARRRDVLPSRRAVRRRLTDAGHLGDVVSRAGALLREGDAAGLQALMTQVEKDGLLTY